MRIWCIYLIMPVHIYSTIAPSILPVYTWECPLSVPWFLINFWTTHSVQKCFTECARKTPSRYQLPQQGSNCPIYAGILASLILCMSCAGKPSGCYLFMKSIATSFLWDSISQQSSPSPSSDSFSASSPRMFRQGCLRFSELWPVFWLHWQLNTVKKSFSNQNWKQPGQWK